MNPIKKEKVLIETTIRKEIEETTYLGLFSWRKVINTSKIKDDIIIYIPYNSSIDLQNIWLCREHGDKQKLIIEAHK